MESEIAIDPQGPRVYPQCFKVSIWQKGALAKIARTKGTTASDLIQKALAPIFAEHQSSSESPR